MPRTKNSFVWEHFSQPNHRGRVVCHHCHLEFSYHQSTGNLQKHVKIKYAFSMCLLFVCKMFRNRIRYSGFETKIPEYSGTSKCSIMCIPTVQNNNCAINRVIGFGFIENHISQPTCKYWHAEPFSFAPLMRIRHSAHCMCTENVTPARHMHNHVMCEMAWR